MGGELCASPAWMRVEEEARRCDQLPIQEPDAWLKSPITCLGSKTGWISVLVFRYRSAFSFSMELLKPGGLPQWNISPPSSFYLLLCLVHNSPRRCILIASDWGSLLLIHYIKIHLYHHEHSCILIAILYFRKCKVYPKTDIYVSVPCVYLAFALLNSGFRSVLRAEGAWICNMS